MAQMEPAGAGFISRIWIKHGKGKEKTKSENGENIFLLVLVPCSIIFLPFIF